MRRSVRQPHRGWPNEEKRGNEKRPRVLDEVKLDCGYRLDLLVDRGVIVEVKSVEALLPIHTAQVLTYLRLAHARQALLINFNHARLKDGLKSYLPGERLTQTSEPRG